MWVVVPVKRFSNAKSRLSQILSDAERESLAQAMLNDVLQAIAGASRVSGVAVVSHEVRARYAVERIGGLYVEESGSGLSDAIRQAGSWLHEHGQRGLLMIPGDVPLASSREIDQIVAAHAAAPAVSIVPDREHDGTNALAVSPPDAIDYAFGRGSFATHRERAERAGLTPLIMELGGFALDIDHPLDLQTLLSFDTDRETESLAWLSDSGIARRVAERHNNGHTSSEAAAANRLM